VQWGPKIWSRQLLEHYRGQVQVQTAVQVAETAVQVQVQGSS
jgi:hypothetical protein